jgi:hypothetical protein
MDNNTVFRQPINIDNDKFNIIFNPLQQNKDSIELESITEIMKKSYIDAIVPRIKTNIQISNLKYMDDIEQGNITEEDLFDLAGLHIMSYVKDETKQFCTNLYDVYIESSLKKCNAIITLQREEDKIISFATLYFDPPNILYIDVICSSQLYSGGGNALLDKIKELCKKIFIKELKLSSVTESLDFYTKKNDFVCDELCNLKLQISKNGGNPRKNGKWTMKYKKSINCKKPKGFSQKQYCKYGRKKQKKQSKKRNIKI